MSECAYCEEPGGILGIKLYKCSNCGDWYCWDCWKDCEFYYFNKDEFEYIFGELGIRTFLFEEGFWICKYCWYEEGLNKFNKKYKDAVENHNDIKMFSTSYRGVIPANEPSKIDYLKTEEFFYKGEAEKSLQVMAHYYKYDCIVDFSYKKIERTKFNSNYIESYWKAYGYGATLKKIRPRKVSNKLSNLKH